MKGLADEHNVFVNLGLKKKKSNLLLEMLKQVQERRAATCLQALYSRWQENKKLVFTGNENNTGSGFDWGEMNELSMIAQEETNGWLMSSNYLETVNNFGSRRYIKNQRWDNRLQINTPFGKTWKNKTEIGLLKDRQQQLSYHRSSLYSDTACYFTRADTTHIRHRPTLLAIN